jgi:hypothetical protein
MLHLRLSVDAKCPRHPNRSYEMQKGGCPVCLALHEAHVAGGEAERHIRFAGKLGAEVRHKDHRRHSPSRASVAQPADSPEPGATAQGGVEQSSAGAES